MLTVGSLKFAAGGYKANGVLFADSSGVASSTSRVTADGNAGYVTSNGYYANTNNTANLGSALNSFANAYVSGTVNGVNATYTGTVTQGSFVTQPDAGYVPFLNCMASSTAGVKAGCSFHVGGTPIFGIKGISSGDGYGSASSSSYGFELVAPMVYSAGATTTVTTSTLLGIDASRYMVISGNATTGTTPQQLFATTTADTVGGTTIRLTGVSSTQLLIISGATTVDVDTTLPFEGIAKTCYLKAGMTLEFMWYANRGKWIPVNPSPYICK